MENQEKINKLRILFRLITLAFEISEPFEDKQQKENAQREEFKRFCFAIKDLLSAENPDLQKIAEAIHQFTNNYYQTKVANTQKFKIGGIGNYKKLNEVIPNTRENEAILTDAEVSKISKSLNKLC